MTVICRKVNKVDGRRGHITFVLGAVRRVSQAWPINNSGRHMSKRLCCLLERDT